MMMTMEDLVAELEMEVDPILSLINNPYQHFHQCETTKATISEQVSTMLSEDFSYPYSSDSNTTTPDQWDFDNIIIAPLTPPPQIFDDIDNNNNNNNGDSRDKIDVQGSQIIEESKEDNNKKVKSGGAKRKRQPNQVQDHIIAERRRRELLSQMFITLSSLVPGLKKIDKTSVLGEAIKYMTELQKKVKMLEEVVSKRTVESVVVVKKSQLIVNDDNDTDNDNDSTSTVDDNSVSGNISGNGGQDREVDESNNSLPEIEVKISGETMLLKIHCENKKGVLRRLFDKLENHSFSVITNCNVVPFESLMLDITIVAQMEKGFKMNTRSFVRDLRSIF